MRRSLPFALFLLVLCYDRAIAEEEHYWSLPTEVTEENATVSFDVDSTWHLVHGVVHKISGRIWLDDPQNFSSVRGDIRFPVGAFDTENSLRDSRLREVLDERDFEYVRFSLNRLENLCAPRTVLPSSPCNATAFGDLTIRSISKTIAFPVIIRREGTDYVIQGTASLDWTDFGVKDPSIIVAKLDHTVTVRFQCHLRQNKD